MRRQALLGGRRHDCISCRRLWAHEALRIFHDRLVNDDDRRWFGNYLKAAVQEHLHLNFDEVFATPASSAGAGHLDVLSATRSLLYCNFLTQVPSTNALQQFILCCCEYNRPANTHLQKLSALLAVAKLARCCQLSRHNSDQSSWFASS